ncbi:MAG: hypothetical protein ABIG68_02815 [Acidobacteriota bacterium]
MTRKLFALSLVGFAARLFGQAPATRIGLAQLRGDTAAADRVVLTLATGDVIQAELDPATLQVTTLPSGVRQLRANVTVPNVPPARVYDEVAAVDTSDPEGRTFKISRPASQVSVYIDGVRKFSGPDYQILDASTFRFVAGWGNQSSNRITADYNPLS